jgi:hypothetical protein
VAFATGSDVETGKTEGYSAIHFDLSRASSVASIFHAVKLEFGSSPSVVIYDATTLVDVRAPFLLPAENPTEDSEISEINTVSAYVAVQEAARGFDELPREVKKACMFIWNVLKVKILPVLMFLTLGVGGLATKPWTEAADAAFASKGYR